VSSICSPPPPDRERPILPLGSLTTLTGCSKVTILRISAQYFVASHATPSSRGAGLSRRPAGPCIVARSSPGLPLFSRKPAPRKAQKIRPPRSGLDAGSFRGYSFRRTARATSRRVQKVPRGSTPVGAFAFMAGLYSPVDMHHIRSPAACQGHYNTVSRQSPPRWRNPGPRASPWLGRGQVFVYGHGQLWNNSTCRLTRGD
jgi:hypothetical protein